MSATVVCPEPLQLRADLTLGELLTRAHEDVQDYGVAECPVCGGNLHAHGTDAECTSCGSRLA